MSGDAGDTMQRARRQPIADFRCRSIDPTTPCACAQQMSAGEFLALAESLGLEPSQLLSHVGLS